MVGALDRKLLRDLVRLKGQVLTISLVVAGGIGAYVAMKTTWDSLNASKTSYYERYRFADVFAKLERAPDSVKERIEEIPGVSVVQTRVVQPIMLPMANLPEPAVGTLISIPGNRQPPLNQLYLRSGRLPEPGRADEVVVMQTFVDAHDLLIGDTVPAVINGSRRELIIVGTALSPEFVFPASAGDFAPDDKRIAIIWMDREVLAPAYKMDGAFNDVALRLQPGAEARGVLGELDRILEPYGGLGAVPRAKQQSNFMLEGELQGLEKFATAFPVIFLLVGAFLLNLVLARLVNLQRQQIAVLKALGYSNRRIGLHYLELVFVISLIGSVIGVAVGVYLGERWTALYTQFFRFPVLEHRVAPNVVAVAVLVSAGAAVVGALATVLRVAKLPPAESMRPPAPTSYRRSLLDRIGLGRIFGQSAMMVIREVRRRPWRLILSSLGIAAGVGVLVIGRFGYDSFEYLLYTVFHEEQRGDMTVAFIEHIPERASREIIHLPGVLDAEGNRVVPVRFRSGHLYRDSVVYGIADQPRLRRVVDRSANEVALPDAGLAISRKLGEILEVGVGDALRVEMLEGNREKLDVRVAMLVDDAFGLQGYMRTSKLHQLLGQEPAVSMIHLKVDPAHMEELHRRLKEMPTVGAVTRKQTLIDRFNEQTGEMMLTMTLIMTGFAVVISIGVVYNNARVALSMRSRDLASLRVLGFTRGEISAVLLGELGVQLVLALPIGLVLGTYWAHAVMSTVDPEVYRMPIVVSSQSYAFAVLVTAGAGIISALLVRRKLDHLDLIAVLKTRE